MIRRKKSDIFAFVYESYRQFSCTLLHLLQYTMCMKQRSSVYWKTVMHCIHSAMCFYIVEAARQIFNKQI